MGIISGIKIEFKTMTIYTVGIISGIKIEFKTMTIYQFFIGQGELNWKDVILAVLFILQLLYILIVNK